jgi:hypothetical protein
LARASSGHLGTTLTNNQGTGAGRPVTNGHPLATARSLTECGPFLVAPFFCNFWIFLNFFLVL